MSAKDTKDNKGENDGKPKPVIIRNTTDYQRLKLEKLMKNPDKPVMIPERPKERGGPHVPDFVRNVMGSSAGAGSGEFHVYRHLRRKEYARQKFMSEKGEREKLNEDYQQKLEDNKRKLEEKTAKKRAKRLKRKMKQKNKGKKPKANQSASESSSENETSEEDSLGQKEDKLNMERTEENKNSDKERIIIEENEASVVESELGMKVLMHTSEIETEEEERNLNDKKT